MFITTLCSVSFGVLPTRSISLGKHASVKSYSREFAFVQPVMKIEQARKNQKS